MTNTLSVQTNDVTGFRAFTYQHHGPRARCGYLFAARHELHVFIEDGDFQSLAGSGSAASLLRVSLKGRVGKLTLTAPDFGDKPTWPFERAAVQRVVEVTVDGDAVLRLSSASPVRYQVVVGMLRCAFEPMFEAWRDGPGAPSALAAFWPSLPPAAKHLDYVFTPLGLALEGVLDVRMPERRDILLLPRHQPDADDGDAAWNPVPNTEKQGTHTWERLQMPAPAPARPNLALLVERLRADAPDPQAWPVAQPRWAMLRWRLMTPDSQPFIDFCFETKAPGVRMERPLAASADAGFVHAELVCQLWVSVDGADAQLEYGGMVCSVVGAAMTAQFIWDARERNSVLTARTARAALWVAGSGALPPEALFNVVRLTLRTAAAADGPVPNLVLEWERGKAPASAHLTLAPTGMLCGGAVEGGAGIAPPSTAPTWLVLEQDCLQFAPNAVPVDTDDNAPAAALLAAAADSTQVFRGGLPLAALGGPAGLTAWVSRGAGGTEPDVVLRIHRDTVELSLYDAILVWRTPGWWCCTRDKYEEGMRVPPLGAPFIEALAAPPADRAEADLKLGQALASVLFPALWVGRAGAAAAGGWSLDISGDGQLGFVLPAAAVRATVLWSAFRDAYLVQTVPAGGQALGGPLLDPARSQAPLTHAAGEPLRLVLGASGLARLATPRYPTPSGLAAGWKAVGGEFFHPNIAGLALNPAAGNYSFRHGPPMLADGYLRARLDGSFGSTLASGALGTVRPSDDVAIEAIRLAPEKTEVYRVRGWLAAPYTVAVDNLAITLGGADPHIAMIAAGGADGHERHTLRIGSRDDGFVDPVAVFVDGAGKLSYLTADLSGGKRLRNFGQALAVDDPGRTFRDGAGRSWTPFADGARAVSTVVDGKPSTRRRLTQQRLGVLGAGALGVVELSVCLADFDPAAPDRGSAWDLSGPLEAHTGSRPMFGPFALQPDVLRTVDDNTAEVSARLGGPGGDPGLPPIAAAGALLLRWTKGPRGWDLSLGDNPAFEWRIDAAPGPAPSVASVGGTLVAQDAQLAVIVNRVSLHTGMGEVTLPCEAAALEYTFEDGVCTAFDVAISVDHVAGVSADFKLHYRFRASALGKSVGWSIAATPAGEPSVRWESEAGEESLALALGADKAGAIRFTSASGLTQALTLAQAGAQRWLVLEDDGGGVELAGCLERHDGPGQPTQLRLAYSWTARLDDAQALFGPLDKDSRVRVDGSADWRSKGLGGRVTPPVRKLSGHLALDNDYVFQFAQRSGAAVTMYDRVHCYFDAQPLDATGKVIGGVLHAMVEHRFHTGTVETPVFSFQVPQAIGLATASDGKVSMAANGVVLLRTSDDGAYAPQVVPQLLYEGDRALGACHGPGIGRGQVGGTLLRLPLRTGTGRATLRVPVPQLPNLSWFPLVLPETGEAGVEPSRWQERRALARALDAGAIADICASTTPAEFAARLPLPGDGESLPEWSALAQAAGWLHSGLLRAGAGVLATPYYAGVLDNSAITAADGAVPVTLFVPDASIPGGVRQVAQALIADAVREQPAGAMRADSAALLKWAADEMLRRSLRASALVMAHGRPALSGVTRRRFIVAAVDDDAQAPQLPPRVEHPRHSALIELLRPGEAPAAAPQVLTARTDQDAVLEAVDAQPLVAGHQPALRVRLALNHVVDDAGRFGAVSARGAALSKRQRIVFEEPINADSDMYNVLPLVSPPHAPVAQVVSPVLVDVCNAALRPGDMVQMHWALRGDGAETGPGLEFGLRSARAGRAVADGAVDFKIAEAAIAHVDGVTWQLHDTTAARSLGLVPAPIADQGIEATVVTPRGTIHRLVPLEADTVGNWTLTLGVASHQADDAANADGAEAARDLSLRLLEPLFCGAFPHAMAGLLPKGAEMAWAVAAGDGARGSQGEIDQTQVSGVEEICASARALETWNGGGRIRVVRLGSWQSLDDRPGHALASADPAGYSLAPGAGLARLLRLTHKDRNAPRHWLLKEGKAAGPLLVMLIRSNTSLRYAVAFAIDWHRGAALEQPERVLAVRGEDVLGFGDLAGPVGIRLEGKEFMLYNTAYALGSMDPEDSSGPARAWLFGRGGEVTATSFVNDAPDSPV